MTNEERGNGEEPRNEDPSPECSNEAAGLCAISSGFSTPVLLLVAAAAPASEDPPEEPASDAKQALVDDNSEFITVYLSEIRKEMQCPICLGIIRKTRTVMECLHRFCRECIDKSMRLGNNECPACRTHCASRRSLRDDPNFDSLIAALYQDIDKYEEEEMSLLEEETWKNKQIQANIAETAKRQTEALAKRRTAKATAAAIVRKAHGKFRPSGRSRSSGGARGSSRRRSRRESSPLDDESDEKEEAVEPRRTSTRKRQRPAAFDSSVSVSNEESNESDEDLDLPPDGGAAGTAQRKDASANAANGDTMVSWAKGGARSQPRHGTGAGGGAGPRHVRCMRATALLESFAATGYPDINELDVQFTLQPLNDVINPANTLPSLERPHLCCSPKLSVHQLCSFLMSHDLFPVDTELEIVAECDMKDMEARQALLQTNKMRPENLKMLQVLDSNAVLGDVYNTHWNKFNSLSLLYRRKC